MEGEDSYDEEVENPRGIELIENLIGEGDEIELEFEEGDEEDDYYEEFGNDND